MTGVQTCALPISLTNECWMRINSSSKPLTKIHKYTIDALKNTKRAANGKIPVGVGFGVSTEKDVQKYVSYGANAVIVGSANIKIMENTPANKIHSRIEVFTKRLKKETR